MRTRVILFHWNAEGQERDPVDVRADLLTLDGERLGVLHAVVGPGRSVTVEVGEIDGAERLRGGAGTIKLVVDSLRVGSLRPYFQFVSDGGVTSTHEKSSPKKETPRTHDRRYHWVFPVGKSSTYTEAFYYCVNPTTQPICGRRLVWQPENGPIEKLSLPDLELDQGALVPLHKRFSAIATGGEPGTVRLTPSAHVAGHVIRHDRESDRWLVQHL